MPTAAAPEAVPGEGRGEETEGVRRSIWQWLGREAQGNAKTAGVQHPRYIHYFTHFCDGRIRFGRRWVSSRRRRRKGSAPKSNRVSRSSSKRKPDTTQRRGTFHTWFGKRKRPPFRLPTLMGGASFPMEVYRPICTSCVSVSPWAKYFSTTLYARCKTNCQRWRQYLLKAMKTGSQLGAAVAIAPREGNEETPASLISWTAAAVDKGQPRPRRAGRRRFLLSSRGQGTGDRYKYA